MSPVKGSALGSPSRQRVQATLRGGLGLRPEPTVVAARAHHVAELTAGLTGGAELTAAEQVLLGRSGEEPGRWIGTTRIERAGRPLLHITAGLGSGGPAWLPPVGLWAYASTVHLGGGTAEAATVADAVRPPLPGGWVTTAESAELHRAEAAPDALDGPVAVPA